MEEQGMEDISNQFVFNFYDSRIAKGIIDREGTPEAIKYFAENCEGLTDYSYWFFLSTCWVSYSGWYELEKWKALFSSDRPKREKCIMKPSEIKKLKQLPFEIKCYRAHREGEKDWISYTTDINVAVKMALSRGVHEIKEYKIKKNSVLAYFTRRGESEIILLDKSKAEYIKTYELKRQSEKIDGVEGFATPTK